MRCDLSSHRLSVSSTIDKQFIHDVSYLENISSVTYSHHVHTCITSFFPIITTYMQAAWGVIFTYSLSFLLINTNIRQYKTVICFPSPSLASSFRITYCVLCLSVRATQKQLVDFCEKFPISWTSNSKQVVPKTGTNVEWRQITIFQFFPRHLAL